MCVETRLVVKDGVRHKRILGIVLVLASILGQYLAPRLSV